jgi:hypothetical protein
MAYSKAKLKSNGDKASPCFRPFWTGKLSDKCLSIWTFICIIIAKAKGNSGFDGN